MRILYVEDEKFLAEAVKHNLEKQKIDVDLAFNGKDGLDMATQNIYDVVVLDIMLPEMSGFDILSNMRAKKINTPTIMLSALSEVEDKVRGLNLGADDYLAKPFKTVELVARLNALVRRPAQIQSNCLKFQDLVYDIDEQQLNGNSLTAKEAKIIEALLKNPEKVIKKDYLRNHIWGQNLEQEDNYIEVYISRLRKLLVKLGSKTRIVTVRGLGYKIVSE